MKRELFDRWHPDAAVRAGEYQLLMDSWGGTGGYRPPLDAMARDAFGAAAPQQPAWKSRSYLDPHPRETDEKYNRRAASAVFLNLVRRIGKIFLGFLFRRGPTRKPHSHPAVKRFLENVDGRGTNMDGFLREVARRAWLFGTCPIVVDRPAEESRTARTYAQVLYPQMLRDWDADEDGTLRWVKLFDEVVSAPAADADRVVTQRAKIWYADSWELWTSEPGSRDEAVFAGGGLNHIDEIPLVLARFGDSLEPTILGSTPAFETALLNRDLYNCDSERREHRRGQVFAILVTPPLRGTEQPDLVVVGSENVLIVPADATVMPQFLAPPSSVAQTLAEDRAIIRRDILQLWGFGYYDEPTGGPESGLARMFQFEEANATFRGFSHNLVEAERGMVRLALRWAGLTQEKAAEVMADYSVEWPESFDIRDLQRELEIAVRVLELPLDLVSRFAALRAVRDAAVQLSDRERAASDKELAAMMKAMRLGPPPARDDDGKEEEDGEGEDDQAEVEAKKAEAKAGE
jgi:hypothetical protein